MPIRILAPQVANQIAAGEVVERPASVIKELIENSLDAGASDIRVEVREGGRRLMRVQDDGCGIPAAETRLAFQRHATSKIVSADDLTRLTTLGFRGEALASIASVAQVTLLTRALDEEIGTLVRMSEGHEVARESKGSPPGAVVTVEHLFGNVPARLKFLKRVATEAGHIQQIVTRYALAYPERRFSLVSDGKLIFQSTGSGKLYDVIVKVYGLEMARQMLEVGKLVDWESGKLVDWENGNLVGANQSTNLPSPNLPIPNLPIYRTIRVTGYTAAPTLHRSNRGYINLFINRRWFQDTSVAYAVIQAYHTMLPVGRSPVALIFIEMPPEDVDVNVHPTKAEVRFRDNHAVFSAVQRAVRAALTAQAPLPESGLGRGAQATPAGPTWGGLPESTATPFGGPSWAARREALLGAGRGGGQMPMTAAPDAASMQTPPEGEPGTAAHPAPPDFRPQMIPILRVVGQLGATYIVAEGPDGLYLIDQHAAHERILYEQMLADHARDRIVIQSLLEPLVLDLSPEQAAVVAGEIETLNELGVAIEAFGGASYLVRAVPAILSGADPQSALIEIIDGLADNSDVVESAHEARLVITICKRAAIKGGHPLSMAEMQELVRGLEGCQAPTTCPHGRPTMVHMSAAELARQFGRTYT
ncbi:MAG: DNA mismatch repair protein MutL [Chloroflexi bacterium HGW-Chloroflexi-1]|nr:MAG: DNA mismatch repair protein MutL [Chloroflexi bacterium HGW-Chloroflexi-1]